MNESTQPKAKKSLGQHFLRHESICNRIASLLLPKDTDNVIEIGPGPGALTRAIEAQPHARLVLLEKDSSGQALFQAACGILHDGARRASMESAMSALGIRDATERIYQTVLEICQ